MSSWWPVLTLVGIATATDLHSRRIPNWLTLPFLGVGVAVTTAVHGTHGLEQSMGGIALAAVVMGLLCWLGGMGMGDLKLCAAVGAWIGPAQLGMALVTTAIAGGLLALIWATFHGWLTESLNASSDLVWGFWKNGIHPNREPDSDKSPGRTMPYAPAIAIGTIFSFLTTS